MYWLVGVKNLRRNKNRTVNVVVILALLIASNLTLFVGSAAIQAQAEALKKSVGTAIEVRPIGSPMGTIYPDAPHPFVPQEIVKEAQKIPGVLNVTAYLRIIVDEPSSPAGTVTITGVTPGQVVSPATMGADVGIVKPVWGQSVLTARQMSTNDAIIGLAMAQALSLPTSQSSASSMGSSMASNMTFKVQGIIDRSNIKFEATFNHVGVYSSGTVLGDYGVFAPLPMVQALYKEYQHIDPVLSDVFITVDSTDHVLSVVNELKRILGDNADVIPPQVSSSFLGETLSGVASNGKLQGEVSLSLGILIAALTMALLTAERRKEIGVMKAIGASSRQVMLQLSVEGLALTLLGGLSGLAIYVTVGQRLSEILFGASTAKYATLPLTPNLMLTIVGYSLGASILFAALGILYPAFKVTRIDPTEAIRHA